MTHFILVTHFNLSSLTGYNIHRGQEYDPKILLCPSLNMLGKVMFTNIFM
ncbi:protein of unknown function [Candidatus Nitrosocosmicus franklandus]|uniref:Uncharacterized protein n=1 Tax=Candidatus Nitrosocosmicus franklandianus TaxID=1798806 RepID=A0A484I796_9ARCH|nr:protein of unknown function [Candidatus Nitrosocosmicus franklandus]